MMNVRFIVTSSETILSVITVFTLMAIICEMACWRERGLSMTKGQLGWGVAPCKLDKVRNSKSNLLNKN